MFLKRIVETDWGSVLISGVLGLGLAALFQKACKDNNCVIFFIFLIMFNSLVNYQTNVGIIKLIAIIILLTIKVRLLIKN